MNKQTLINTLSELKQSEPTILEKKARPLHNSKKDEPCLKLVIDYKNLSDNAINQTNSFDENSKKDIFKSLASNFQTLEKKNDYKYNNPNNLIDRLSLSKKIEQIKHKTNTLTTAIEETENFLPKQESETLHNYFDNINSEIETIISMNYLVIKCPALLLWTSNRKQMVEDEVILLKNTSNPITGRKGEKQENVKQWLSRILKNADIKQQPLLKEIRRINPTLARAIDNYSSEHGSFINTR